MTKPERFEASLASASGADRWNYGKRVPSLFSLNWVRDLLAGQPGDFRIFAFVLAGGDPEVGAPADWVGAAGWWTLSTRESIPDGLQLVPLGGRRCQVFVYHYRSKDGFNHVLCDGTNIPTPSVQDHLRANGLLTYFTGVR